MPRQNNVSTGKPKVTGAVFRAPAGTALPTSAPAALSAAFAELGYVSSDGVTNSNTPDSDTVKAWGGQPVLVVQNEKKDEWKLTFIEALNPNVLETVYGSDNVSYNATAGTIAVQATADQMAEHVYVIDIAMRDGAMKRVVIPSGVVQEVADVVYKDDEPVGYEITLAALPNSSGVTHFEYILLPSGGTASISLDKSTASVAVGESVSILPTTSPEGATVIWGSSDNTKAIVNGGVVTGVAAGSAVITAFLGGLTASCTVTVTGS